MKKLFYWFVLCGLLAACAAPPPPVQSQSTSDLQSQSPVTEVASTEVSLAAATDVHGDTSHTDTVDVTRLVLGDGKVSQSPQTGYVFSCMTQFNGGGAQGTGNWMNGDGTWDATKKAVVDGTVTWPHAFTITVSGDQRNFVGNDLPDHPTGTYPIAASDDAYAVDRNPNSIQAQTVSFSVPANPTVAEQPTCVGGEVGIMLSGVVIFSAFDAEGRDAVAHEVQDTCDGHPQLSGFYHYHSLSDCFEDTVSGHSALMGYAFDGFGIYGYYGEDSREVTNADLDACHGHTHVVEWDGQLVEMYHYHATREFPYVVGCFKGTPSVRALTAGEGQGGLQAGQGQGNANQQPGQPGGGPGAGQAPQEAVNACVGLSQSAACSFTTPNGSVAGTCGTPPNMSQLVCMPAGGPP